MPERIYQQNILAFWRQGKDVPPGGPTSRQWTENHALYTTGHSGVLSLMQGIYGLYNLKYTLTNDPRTTTEAVGQLQQALEERDIALSWFLYPDDTDSKKVVAMQTSIRTGLEILNNELRELLPTRVIEPHRFAHYAGALYVPPPEIAIGEPWLPAELLQVTRQRPS